MTIGLKRISALFTLTAMIMSLSVFSVMSEVRIKDDDVIIAQDSFENYEPGTELAELYPDWSIVTDAPGSSVTIENDAVNNTKAIKLTQDLQERKKTGNPYTGFKIEFKEALTEGIVNIKFKVRGEYDANGNNGAIFNKGILYDSQGNVVTNIEQWTKEWYSGNISDWNNNRFVVLYNKALGDGYATVHICLNLNDKTYTLNGNSATYGKRKLERVNENIKDLKSIDLTIAANGLGDYSWIPVSDIDPVYWIDDIDIRRYPVSDTVLVEDFERYDTGEKLSDVLPEWEVTEASGGSVRIEKDETTGSNAVKLTASKNETLPTGFRYKFPKTTNGKVRVSYKFRSENNSVRFNKYGLCSDAGNYLLQFMQHKDVLYTNIGNWGETNPIGLGKAYKEYVFDVDMENNTVKLTVDDVLMYDGTMKQQSDISGINIYASTNVSDVSNMTDFLPDREGDGVYWIDDFKVTIYDVVEVNNSGIINGAENVDINSEISYTFDRDINADTVNYQNVSVLKNGKALSENEYSLNYENCILKIILEKGVEYDSSYGIILSKDISGFSGATLKGDLIYTFTTMSNPQNKFKAELQTSKSAPVIDITELAGKEAVLYAKIDDEVSDYTFIGALKDDNGRLLSAKAVKAEDIIDGCVKLNMDIPQNVNNSYTIEAYLWNMVTLKPLSEKINAFKPVDTQKIYVDASAKSGNGSFDNPYTSLEEANDAVHSIRKYSVQTIEVILKEGVYNQKAPIGLSRDNNNVIYRAYANDNVTLCAGDDISISEFSVADDDRIKENVRGNVKKVNIKAKGITGPSFGVVGHSKYYIEQAGIASGRNSNAVFAQGNMMIPARYPNDGYMTISSVVENGSINTATNTWDGKGMSITVDDVNVSNWANAEEAYLFGYWFYDWTDMSMPVKEISGNTITTTIPNANGTRVGQRFYIYNLLEELDAPGEWYYDKNSGDFYFYPPEGCETVTINNDLRNLINISYAEGIKLYGMTLENTSQDTVNIKDSYNVKIQGCIIRNAARYGVYISGGEGVNISSNDIYNMGYHGVYAEGGDKKNLIGCKHTVENNKIHKTSLIRTRYAPNIEISGVGITVENNELYDATHSAIMFSGNDNLIKGNKIHNVLSESADSGAIYSGKSAVNRGTVISDNDIYDISTNSPHKAIYGVYLDDCLNGTTVENNRIDIDGSAVFINGGRDNKIINNILTATENGVILSTAGLTNWYGDDNSFIAGLGLTSGLHTSTPYAKYEHLANILEDDVRWPKYNNISSNTFNQCETNVQIWIYDKDSIVGSITEDAIRKINIIEE